VDWDQNQTRLLKKNQFRFNDFKVCARGRAGVSTFQGLGAGVGVLFALCSSFSCFKLLKLSPCMFFKLTSPQALLRSSSSKLTLAKLFNQLLFWALFSPCYSWWSSFEPAFLLCFLFFVFLKILHGGFIIVVILLTCAS
jgi:hypothetical protein